MSTTYYQLWNELIGELGSDLPPAQAKLIVNKAWQEIMNSRPWSFLLAEGPLIAPAAITGNVTFTQYSQAAICDATLQTALDALSSQPPVGRRALRVSDSSSGTVAGSPIYQIYDYLAGVLTLNRAYQEASGSFPVLIYRQYYTPPLDAGGVETNDFLRFLNVKDFTTNFTLNLSKDIRWLNRVDTNRTSTGVPQFLVQAPSAPVTYPGVAFDGPLYPGMPLYEIWPAYTGTVQRTYMALYQRRGLVLSDNMGDVDSVLPYQIDPELVLAGSRKRAYRWAEINKGKLPYLQKVNWIGLMQEAQSQYDSLWLDMNRLDEEIYMQNFIPRWPGLGVWNMSADFMQTHDVPLMGNAYGGGGWWGGW